MLDDGMTNQHRLGHGRAQIIAEAAHGRVPTILEGEFARPEGIFSLRLACHPARKDWSTTVLLNESRGSEQYHSTNSSIRMPVPSEHRSNRGGSEPPISPGPGQAAATLFPECAFSPFPTASLPSAADLLDRRPMKARVQGTSGRVIPDEQERVGGFTSASPRPLDGGDVDLLHRHHRLEGTLGPTATSRKRIG